MAAPLNSFAEFVPDRKSNCVDNNKELVTVLLVEDTEDNRQMMKRLLEMSGFRVVEAINGVEAVEVANQERPKIIMMDFSLPFIGGLAATGRIRSLTVLSSVGTVSGHDQHMAAICRDRSVHGLQCT